MPWFKVDDSFYGHPKRANLAMSAVGLWTLAGSWCAQQLSDGFVPRYVLAMLGGRQRDARALVDAGLWVEKDGGWQFHDWDVYQPSRAQVQSDRHAARERQRRARDTAKSRRESQGSHSVTSRRESRRDSEDAVAEFGQDSGGILPSTGEILAQDDAPSGQSSPVKPQVRGPRHGVTSEMSQRESRSPRPDPTRPSSGTGPQSSTDRSTRGRIDDDGLTKIATATHGNRDHARRTAEDILTRANGVVRDPLGYVLRAIGETPERYRPQSGRHPPGPRDPRCPDHPGEHRDRCRCCAADRLTARPSPDAGAGASDEPPW